MLEKNRFVREQLDAIINSIYNGVVVIDRRGIITVFNPTAERVFGIKACDAVGRHIEEVLPDSDLYKILQTGQAQLGHKQVIGSMVIITNRTPVMHKGELIGAVGTFQDITELERIAEQLEKVQELKATLEAVIENPYEGIIVVDKDGFVTVINETYLRLVGRTREEVLGRHISLVNENCNLPQVLETGEPQLCDFCSVRDRGMITMRVPIVKDGKVVGGLGKTLFTDINIAKALTEKLNQLEGQLEFYKREYNKIHGSSYVFDDIIGESEEIQNLKSLARRIARSVSTVLITGESGTGKELFAHAIHNASDRWNKQFVKVNCAAIPNSLLESELFGYVEGAFTGAKKGGKPGKFELADKGTIFLDEIGDMPLVMQAKLLRVLQEREVERVGGLQPLKVDVRVIAATNHDLEKLVQEGKFREDLYYRLNIIEINIPPLRQHLEDLPLLVDSLVARLNTKLKKRIRGVSREALELLQQYSWPGNIRELENMLELAINMSEGDFLEYDDFPCVARKVHGTSIGQKRPVLADAIAQVEREMLLDALQRTGGDKQRAAHLLQIHPSALYRKLKKYNIR